MFSQLDKRNSPIGIFDSGLGGLTVAHSINALLPAERIIYFGDTAHTPWGNKSVPTINNYVEKIVAFLIEQNCKVIVMACNTAASVALERAKEIASWHDIKILNVIDPVVEHINSIYLNDHIGIIGTKQTIKSDVYQRKIISVNPNMKVTSLATPLLVPLIEEGWLENEPMLVTLKHYLGQLPQELRALVLGCTHYPVISEQIKKLNPKLDIINSAKIIAEYTKDFLNKHELNNTDETKNDHHFYVSDDIGWFEPLARRLFFPGNFNIEFMPLFR